MLVFPISIPTLDGGGIMFPHREDNENEYDRGYVYQLDGSEVLSRRWKTEYGTELDVWILRPGWYVFVEVVSPAPFARYGIGYHCVEVCTDIARCPERTYLTFITREFKDDPIPSREVLNGAIATCKAWAESKEAYLNLGKA